MPWNIDLTGKREAELDGGDATPGYYNARLIETGEDEKGCQNFVFEILGPTFPGFIHREKLYHPDLSTASPKGVEFLWKKVMSFAKRLGLIGGGDVGKQASVDWGKAVGWEGVISLIDDPYTNPETGKVTHRCKIDFAPLPKDHPSIPAGERKRLGLPPLPGQAEETPTKETKLRGAAKEGKTYKTEQPQRTDADMAKILEGI